MDKYIIRWNAGNGDRFKEVEAASRLEADRYVYEEWRDEIESHANYATVGLSTKKLKERIGIVR